MLFNSYEFIFIFLPITFFIYFYLNKKRLVRASKGFLVVSSLFFYSWWNIIYLPLILCSMLFNYLIGTLLTKDKEYKKVSKKKLLFIGIIGNVGLLGYFKYTDFFIENINLALSLEIPMLNLALPLAISFFTFQQIAYLVDSYRGETKEYDFLNYALFVTFFPQLIAGPIVHHKEMMPQFASKWNLVKSYKNIALGIFIFSIGLFKKVVIADTFAIWATQGFDNTEILTFFEAWATSLSYTFQLYFDFSGYTDMAIGAALLFNIKLPINFNSPYKSTSLIQVWERWHITLSKFVNMYIFKPIVKSYKHYTFSKGMIAIFVSMVIIGLWHGASWMFVFFGAIHGVGIVVNHIWKRKVKVKLHYIIGWFLTFNIINISMIFFRAKEWEDAVKVLKGMVGFNGAAISTEFANLINWLNPLSAYIKLTGSEMNTFISVYTFEMIIVGFILVLLFENSNKLRDTFNFELSKTLFIIVTLVFFYFLNIDINESPFIYFNF